MGKFRDYIGEFLAFFGNNIFILKITLFHHCRFLVILFFEGLSHLIALFGGFLNIDSNCFPYSSYYLNWFLLLSFYLENLFYVFKRKYFLCIFSDLSRLLIFN